MGYTCGYHEGNAEAAYLLTSLGGGGTLASCRQCVPVMLIGVLADQLGLPADGLYAAIERYIKRTGRDARKAAASAAGEPAQEQEATCPYCSQVVTATAEAMPAAQAAHAEQCQPYQATLAGGEGS